jgi:hypothetical protein
MLEGGDEDADLWLVAEDGRPQAYSRRPFFQPSASGSEPRATTLILRSTNTHTMTRREAFTVDEWRLLARTPVDVMFGVVVSSYGGLRRELSTIHHTLRDADEFPAETELVRQLVGFVRLNRRELHRNAESRNLDRSRSVARARDDCREATAVLTDGATEAERIEYGRFVLWCAEQVALAGREGSALGIGGERVGRRERRFLDSLAEALEGPRPDRPD